MIRHADELLSQCEQLTAADTTADITDSVTVADAGRRRYDTLMQRYHDVIGNVAKLVATTTESIYKRDTLSVSC